MSSKKRKNGNTCVIVEKKEVDRDDVEEEVDVDVTGDVVKEEKVDDEETEDDEVYVNKRQKVNNEFTEKLIGVYDFPQFSKTDTEYTCPIQGFWRDLRLSLKLGHIVTHYYSKTSFTTKLLVCSEEHKIPSFVVNKKKVVKLKRAGLRIFKDDMLNCRELLSIVFGTQEMFQLIFPEEIQYIVPFFEIGSTPFVTKDHLDQVLPFVNDPSRKKENPMNSIFESVGCFDVYNSEKTQFIRVLTTSLNDVSRPNVTYVMANTYIDMCKYMSDSKFAVYDSQKPTIVFGQMVEKSSVIESCEKETMIKQTEEKLACSPTLKKTLDDLAENPLANTHFLQKHIWE